MASELFIVWHIDALDEIYKQKNLQTKKHEIMKKVSLTIATFLFFFGIAIAQDNNDTNEAGHKVSIKINTHALVDVEAADGEAASINLAPTAPNEAGLGLNFDNITNNDLWLNYSSIVEKGKVRSVSASMDKDLPTGITIELAVSADAGKGKGKVGTAATSAQALTKSGVTIVSNIKSCYTGSGTEKGHNLTYSLKMDEDSYGDLEAADNEIEITYTITGN